MFGLHPIYYFFPFCLYFTPSSEYYKEDPNYNFQEIAVIEFLDSLNTLLKVKSLRTKQNCEKYIYDSQLSQISNEILDTFKVPNSAQAGSLNSPMINLLQSIKKDDKSTNGEIVLLDINYCGSEKIEGNTNYTVEAEVEINISGITQYPFFRFTLFDNRYNDVSDIKFKILYFKHGECGASSSSYCSLQIGQAKQSIEKDDFYLAKEILTSIKSCDIDENERVQELLAICNNELELLANNVSNLPSELETLSENESRNNLNKANDYFKNENYISARNLYFLVNHINNQEYLSNCNKCISALKLADSAKDYLVSEDIISSFNQYQKAITLCKSTTITNRFNSVKKQIVGKYIFDAENLIQSGQYLDALILVRQVYSFDKANKKAIAIENLCLSYSKSSFIKSELKIAKTIFQKRKAKKEEYARAFKILYNNRDSKYMDGESYTYLGIMEYQPNVYGLLKTIDLPKYEIRSYWEIHILKAISYCDESLDCSESIRSFLNNVAIELYPELNRKVKKK